MTRHEIPTHLGVEDKALLGLSIRQVTWLMGGCSLAYGAWIQWPALPPAPRAVAAAACLLGALVLTFVRPGGRGLEDWLFVALRYRATPRASVWRPREPELAEWRAAHGHWEELAPHPTWVRHEGGPT